ncbi:MAG: CARDB domain-containing protein [Vicinamibacterales bacterium]
MRFIGVRTTNTLTDFTRVRYDYVLTPIEVEPVLSVSGISPSGGTTLGGTAVTITGTDFKAGVSVGIGGALAANVVRVNSTTITAVTAAHAAGAVDVFVENPDGHSATKSAAFTYTTPATTSPAVTTGAVSALTQTSVTLSATVNPNGASTTLYFDYGTTTGYGSTATYGLAGSGAASASHFYSLTGLSCGTTYQYRARGQNSNGTTNGGNQAFTTSACSTQSGLELLTNGSFTSGLSEWNPSGNFYTNPTFLTCRTCPGYAFLAQSDGTPGNGLLGTLSQTVTIPSSATSAGLTFWYHITTQETSTTTPFDVLNVSLWNSSGGFVGTIATLSNLNKTTGYVQYSANLLAYASAGQTVRLQFVATTDGAAAVGLPTVFRIDDASILVTAATVGPTVTTGSATVISQTTATLNGSVNPNGSATSAWFQYGTTTNYGSITNSQNLGAGASQVATSASVGGLTCGTTYHFRAAGQNGVGTQQGSDQTFTTNACAGSSVGSIRVSIVPQAAADAGAQWKLTTETEWHNSGNIVPVPSLTTYTVQFRPIAGWTTPADKSIVLFPAQTDVWIDSDPYVQQPPLPLYENFSGIRFGGGEFVAVGGANTVVTTPDGVSWTRRLGLNGYSPRAVNYGGGLWVVAAGANGGGIMTSPNARDWTARLSDPGISSLHAVTYGQGVHVAVGTKIATSLDGVSWTVLGTSYGNDELLGVAFGNNTFVAVTENGKAFVSGDSVTWSLVTPPGAGTALGSVTYGNSQFVAVGWAGKILTSPDGVNWVGRESGVGDYLASVAYANGTFVAVGNSGRVVTSQDGVNWTSRNSGTANNLRGVAFGNNTFVAAGWAGTLIPLGNTFQPLIASHPVSDTRAQGEDVTFSVAAAGDGPFSYQWRFEGVDIPGETSPSLTLVGVTLGQAGRYAVVVQTASASQLSQLATLTVNAKTTPIVTWASPASIVSGTALTATQLNASASVVGTLVYSPSFGTVLNVGATQTLSVLFTPTDTTNFTTATASVTIDVTVPDVPIPIHDDFDSGMLGQQWRVQDPPVVGSAGTVTLANGRVEMTMGAGNGGTGIASACLLVGDFDISVDYALLNWPANNRHTIQMKMIDLGSGPSGSPGPYRFSGNSEMYGAVFVDHLDQVVTTDLSGTLRLVRSGTSLAGYYRNAAGWVLLGSGTTSAAPTRLSLEFGSANAAATGGVTVAFDNFSVSAGNPDCPPPSPDSLLQVAVVGPGGAVISSDGQISCPGDCVGTYPPGASVPLILAISTGVTFTGWSGDCSGTGACVLSMSADRSVTATFDQAAPDLVETAVSNPPASATAGSTFSVTDTVLNQGGASANASTTRYYLSLDAVKSPGDILLSTTRSISTLAASASSTGSKTVTIPTATPFGAYVLLACADDGGVVTETDEANNCRAAAGVLQVSGPDLVEAAVTNPPAAAVPGSTFSVTDTVLNQGLTTAGSSTTRYYFSLDATRSAGDVLLTGTRSVSSRSPSSSSAGSKTVTIPATTPFGVYYLLACADDLNTVVESDETNNCRASASTGQVSGPDLVETAVSSPPSAVAPGASFSVTDTVLNQGAVTAASSTTRYYLSLDALRSAGDILMSGTRSVSSRSALSTSSGSKSVKVPSATPVGVYYVLACADDLLKVIETNENNNCRASAGTLQVTGPDLVETAVSNPPATASPGGTFSVTDTVLNQGLASAASSTTRYYLSLDTEKSVGDILLTGTRSVSSRSAGSSSTGSKTVTIPSGTPLSFYYLLACTDDLSVVGESDETNNCRVSVTTVQVR